MAVGAIGKRQPSHQAQLAVQGARDWEGILTYESGMEERAPTMAASRSKL
jgi:hypothetical protein